MNEAPQINTGEIPEAIQDLREEMQRDVRGSGSAIERRPKQKPGMSPLAVVASALGSLFVGALGMSLYYGATKTSPDASSAPADVRVDLETAMSPHTRRLEQLTQSLALAQQAAAEDSKAHRLLLDHLAEQVASLEKSVEAQNAAFRDRVDLVAKQLGGQFARQPNPKSEAAVQPATAEAEVKMAEVPAADVAQSEAPATDVAKSETPATDVPESGAPATEFAPAEVAEPEVAKADIPETNVAKAEVPETGIAETEAEKATAVTETPAGPRTDKPETGELIIDNPSKFDLKLLVNGKPLDIKARGVTTIAVTVGAVKTQIANFPDLVQTWDKWKTVEGAKRLTIKVESGTDYYKLRSP